MFCVSQWCSREGISCFLVLKNQQRCVHPHAEPTSWLEAPRVPLVHVHGSELYWCPPPLLNKGSRTIHCNAEQFRVRNSKYTLNHRPRLADIGLPSTFMSTFKQWQLPIVFKPCTFYSLCHAFEFFASSPTFTSFPVSDGYVRLPFPSKYLIYTATKTCLVER